MHREHKQLGLPLLGGVLVFAWLVDSAKAQDWGFVRGQVGTAWGAGRGQPHVRSGPGVKHFPSRHLADGDCAAAQALLPGGLPAVYDAADITISSEVTRQVYDTNGTIEQYLVLTLTGGTTTGRPMVGCAGITQTGTRPGTGGTFSRAAALRIRERIHMYRPTRVGWLPPNVAPVVNTAYEAPRVSPTAAVLGPGAVAYLELLQAVTATLLSGSGSGGGGARRVLAQHVAATTARRASGRSLAEFLRPDGSLPVATAPLHPEVHAAVAGNLALHVAAVQTAVEVDAARGTGPRAARLLDPTGGMYNAGVLAATLLRRLAANPDTDLDAGVMKVLMSPKPLDVEVLLAALPYIPPDMLEAAAAAATAAGAGEPGSSEHTTATLAWAFVMLASDATHLRQEGAHVAARHLTVGAGAAAPAPAPAAAPESPHHGRSLVDTLASAPHLLPPHGDNVHPGAGFMVPAPTVLRVRRLGDADPTGFATQHARNAQALVAALGVAVVVLGVAVTALAVQADQLDNAVDAVQDTVKVQAAQIDNLQTQTDALFNITVTQSEQLGNLRSRLQAGEEHRASLMRSANTALTLNLGLAEDAATYARQSRDRDAELLARVDAANALMRSAAANTTAFVEAAGAALLGNISSAQTTLLSTLDSTIDTQNTALGTLLTAASISQARFSRVVALVRLVTSRESLHASLVGNVYTTLEGLTPNGWRPWWPAEAADPANAPEDQVRWGPRTPAAHMPVDTLSFITTERVPVGGVWPATDTYGAPGHHIARQVVVTFACHGALVLGAANTVTSGGDLLDLLGPTGCVPPLPGSVEDYVANYTGPGARNPNPTNATECTCWALVADNSTCPVVLSGPTAPLVSLTGSTGVPADTPVLTVGGLGAGPFPGPSTPCTAAPVSTQPPALLTSRAEFLAVLGDLQCPPAWASARDRNVSAGRVVAGTPAAGPSNLSPLYIVSAAAAVAAAGGQEVPADTPAVGLGLPPNPRTAPEGMVSLGGGADTCVVNPAQAERVVWPAAAPLVYTALLAAWRATAGARARVRTALYGTPHNFLSLSSTPYVWDPVTGTYFEALHSEYIAVQDGADPVPGDRKSVV